MRRGEHRIEWHRDRVQVIAPDGRVASARWSHGKFLDRSGELDETTSWEALEQSLRLEAEQLIEATNRAAYDARGVDVTQIDRMLALSPRERLEALDAQRRAISRLRSDATVT